MGGTGANHIMLGFGSLIYYADANRQARDSAGQSDRESEPAGRYQQLVQRRTATAAVPTSNCADDTPAGRGADQELSASAAVHGVQGRRLRAERVLPGQQLQPGLPGRRHAGAARARRSSPFRRPRRTTSACCSTKHHVTWKYYGEGCDGGKEDGEAGTFCNICNPFLYSTQIMTNPALRANNQDINDLYTDIQNDTLPAVSIVKPDGLLDGHPASSKLDLFEGFAQKIVEMVQANPNVWNDTAIMITFDEGGGYYDSGYVQPIDFFGDGTRIPLIVVSKYSTGGRVVHTYYDHVSFDKFVEANWSLHETISTRSRDNLPNPIATRANPYVPLNQPAIGDLMDMFDFGERGHW